jgi:catechol 2,3-dioxygenase-like lactoylglutathione lyase family enzyme
MSLPKGIHHLAICTKDIKKQIEFFTQAVGAKLVALYWMHGVDNTFHGFVNIGESCSIAFVQSPEIGEIQPLKGVSHAAWTASPVAAGAMQHVAINVENESDLLAIRDRVRAYGNWVMGPIDHGFCKSIYLAAPEGIMLEFSTSEGKAIDAEAWIDPDVVRLSGISLSDLDRYKNPPAFASRGGAVPNPPVDLAHPPMEFPPGREKIYSMSDAEVFSRMSETTPPVQLKL